jgi:hypothetical protein
MSGATGGGRKRSHGALYTGTQLETAETAKSAPTATAPPLDPSSRQRLRQRFRPPEPT